ncbi:MAG: HEAT repeat domain-containing protein [Planctomycetes bacterium]|nr:HEAT repeat domain-containing protein [Planctomycetota bacterium]
MPLALLPVVLALLLLPQSSPLHPADDDLRPLAREYEAAATTRERRLWLVPRIAALGTEEARDYLIDRFLDGTDRGVKRALFKELARAFSPLPARLTRQSASDADPYVRAATLEAVIAQEPGAAVERARDVLGYDEDPRVRRAAIRFLGSRGDAESARFVFETCARLGLEDQREAISSLAALAPEAFGEVIAASPIWDDPRAEGSLRLLGALILAERAEREYGKRLAALASDGDPLVAFAAGLGLDRIEGRGRGLAVERALAKARDREERCRVRTMAIRAGITDPGLTRVLVEELAHRDWRVRAAAADALGGAAAEDAVAPLIERLAEEKVWQVRVACLEALGRSRRVAAIDFLIGALDGLAGREHRAARQALARLAGCDAGESGEAWRQWRADHSSGFEPPPPSLAEWTELDPLADKYAFYGIAVDSERVVFVLDVSGSMQGEKLLVLKQELGNVIEHLPEAALFNMIFFESQARCWRERMERLTKKNRVAALDAVRYLDAEGGTNLWGAMQAALADERTDSIYLLSDGQPTVGEIIALPAICARLAERNRHQRVAIHVVLIGYQSEVLERLARESGGSYVERG